MRIVVLAQIVAAAVLFCGCPGTPASDPSGGGNCTSKTGCPTGGAGGEGGKEAGSGGTGNSGASTSTSGSGGSNTGGNGAGGAGNGSGGAGTGGNGTGGNGTGGNGTGGNGTGGNGTGGGNAGICTEIEMSMPTLQESAQKCNTEAPAGTQCKQVAQGLCCPFAVNDLNSPEVQAYLEALKKYMDNGCMAMCPPDPCPPTSGAKCTPVPGGGGGTCGG